MGRTFACSDLHGRYDLYQLIIDFLKPDDKVYFLGDAGDRGPDGWKLIKAIYANPQFIYLMGNHEDMLVNAMYEYRRDEGWSTEERYLLYQNGGVQTFEDWLGDEYREYWPIALDWLPLWEEYTNKDGIKIYLTHAGFSCTKEIKNPNYVRDKDLLWDRSHIHRESSDKLLKDIICVHGHTPISYIDERARAGAYWYADRHKVDIDNGSAFSNVACLLDLDIFDEHIFEV